MLEERLRSGGSRFCANLDKKILESNRKIWAGWHVPVLSVTARSVKLGDHSPGQPQQKARPCFQNDQSKKGKRVAQ
jgi:hypothetical protein